MEQRMKCPHCGRCIGFVQSTDDEKNTIFSITKNKPKIVGKKERIFHCTCQRCKEEVYVLMGFKN